MSIKLVIKGDKALIAKLKALGPRIANRVARRAVNLATTPILQAAREHAPITDEQSKIPGLLKRAQAKKISGHGLRYNGIVGADADVSATNEAGKTMYPVFYDHLVEMGHLGPDGVEVPAHPYLRPAWEESIGTARAIHERELAAGIEREAAKQQ
jgi:HK97 gp10 family phage protein